MNSKNSLKSHQAHFDCLKQPKQIGNPGFGAFKKKKVPCCRPNSQGVSNGEAVLTWRKSLKAGELDTITPPSITAVREERESPVRELERYGAGRWIDSLQAEAGKKKKDDREDRRETDCWPLL